MWLKSMKNKKQIIGLIGGMGPFAGVEFCRLLFEKSVNIFGAKKCDDFPEIVLDSVPVRDFISDTKNLSEARTILISRIRKLNKFGCTKIAMVCNTGHILFPELSEASAAELVSLIKLVRENVQSRKFKRVGLLASKTSIKSNLFTKEFASTGIEIVIPDSKTLNICDDVIRNVIANKTSSDLVDRLVENTRLFIKNKKLDGIILGCTELPLAFPKDTELNVVDCLEILSDKLLGDYYK